MYSTVKCVLPVTKSHHKYSYYIECNGLVINMFDAPSIEIAKKMANSFTKYYMSATGADKLTKKAFKLKTFFAGVNPLEYTIKLNVFKNKKPSIPATF